MQVIYGINPLLEMFHSHPALLEKIVVAEGRERAAVQKILKLAAENGVPVESAGRDRVEKLAPRQVHQGIVGLCREHAYATVDDVLANRHKGLQYSLVILLDSVTDPQNLGSIIRTVHCCGGNGVIIPENRSASVTAAVAKASAGAVYCLPTAMVVNMVRTIEYLKEKGFWIYGAAAGSEVSIHAPDYGGDIGLVLGSEGKGIRPLIRKKCDFLISIPMRGQVTSLNVSVAAGIIIHEIFRKRGEGS
ncbi:MAG: 23S rRNA (guanosine(2251)-2'-O)-methyltransferase RlmB [Syntrophus sp. (in: bacteria)]|nr:23S rRNA (guanosine(2251)-2'-O)-methyltransferase RlmB [Syntrophus sp. (in: bacteria)]